MSGERPDGAIRRAVSLLGPCPGSLIHTEPIGVARLASCVGPFCRSSRALSLRTSADNELGDRVGQVFAKQIEEEVTGILNENKFHVGLL